MPTHKTRFGLVDALLVLALLLVLAQLAVPRLDGGPRLSANEAAAQATLRSICEAQEELRTACTRDFDGDGIGEYGRFEDLAPAFLPSAFAEPSEGIVCRSGYCFRIWLPEGDARENCWCAYAWPIDYHATGLRAFCINQDGQVLECANTQTRPFSGSSAGGHTPSACEAYAGTQLSDALRIGQPGGADATTWTRVE